MGARMQASESSLAVHAHDRSAARYASLLLSDGAALYAHVLSLLLGAAVLFFLNRHRWFLWDEWVFFAVLHPQFLAGDFKDFLFAPYVSHWVTIPNVLFELAYRIGGTHYYWVYLAAPISAHLGVTTLVRIVMRRAGVAAWPATLLALPMLLTGAGAGNLTFGWQFQFVGAVFFGLAQALMTDVDGPIGRRDIAGLGLGLLCLMCSGVSLAMIPISALNLALRSRWRAAAFQVVPLTVVYLIWFVTIGHQGLPIQPAYQLALIPLFIWTGISATFDGITGIVGVAPIVLLGGLVLAVRQGILPRLPGYRLPWAMSVAPFLLFLLAGYGRIGAGVDYATGSRYVYIGVACFLPLLAVLISRHLDARPFRWIFVGMLAWSMITNIANLYLEVHLQTGRGLVVRNTVLRLAKDPNLFSMDPAQRVNAPATIDLTVGVIQRMVRAGDLP